MALGARSAAIIATAACWAYCILVLPPDCAEFAIEAELSIAKAIS